jgi:5-methylcytosine-specific restriction endonuclease McrA
MRRYSQMKASKGTVIPANVRLRVLTRDSGCVGFRRFPGPCDGGLELDHVRASHGVGMKSVTCDCNLVALCGACHRYKTANGRTARPILLDYLAKYEYDLHTEHAS